MYQDICNKVDQLSKDLHLINSLSTFNRVARDSFFNIFPEISKAYMLNYNWSSKQVENLLCLSNTITAEPIEITEELQEFFKDSLFSNNYYSHDDLKPSGNSRIINNLDIGKSTSEVLFTAVPFNQATGLFYACSEEIEFFTSEKRALIQLIVNVMARTHKRISMQTYQIKESKKVEKRYIDQRNLMSELLDYLPVSIFISNTDGKYVFFNQHAKESFGLVGKEVIGKTAYDLYPKRFAIKFQAEDERVLKSNKAITFKTREIKNKKKRYSLTGKKVFESTDKQKLILGFSVDITDLIDAKNNLKDQNKFIQLVLDNSPNLIYVKDIDGNFVLANDAIGKLLGVPINNLIGKKDIFKKHLKNTRKEAIKYEYQVFKNLQTIELEEKMVPDDGIPRWFHTIKKPILDTDGNTNLLGICVDITQRKKYAEDLLSAQHAKELFLANMSHEIRTPINGISGLLNLIKESESEHERYLYIDLIKDSTNHLKVIIDDILDFSLIESGKLKLEHIPFRLFLLIENLKQQFQLQANEKSLALMVKYDQTIPNFLVGDPVRLKQILVNLVGNAIKFTNKGGVEISCKLLEQHDEEVKVEFRVKDTGIGIQAKQKSQIFNSFKQADESITRKFGGTGLGLAITKHLVNIMSGNINVESAVEKGSTFTFILPFRIAEKQEVKIEGETSEKPKSSSLKGNTVMIVEDNKTNIIYAKHILKNLELDILIAENGKEAIEKLNTNHIDLILMDIQMPVMDGYEATRHIRNEMKDDKAKTPIIAVTANAIKGEHEKSLERGMNDYISKPFEPIELKNVLSKYLIQKVN